jgi:hypothetical protein
MRRRRGGGRRRICVNDMDLFMDYHIYSISIA